MTAYEKRINIIRSGLEANNTLDFSLYTILYSSWKGGKLNNKRKILQLSKTNKSLFSTHGIFDETISNHSIITNYIHVVERGGSSSIRPRNHPSLGDSYFKSYDKSPFQK